MIDRRFMRSLLENMERAAEETLSRDEAFHGALRELKTEIDNDVVVQAAVGALQATGRSVHKSFVPHIKIRIRTDEGIFTLPKRAAPPAGLAAEQVGGLILELRDAVSAVIENSQVSNEIETIVNNVVGSNDRFEGIASGIESAGYEVMICLDLSAYAQVQGESHAPAARPRNMLSREPFALPFTGSDKKFLAELKISSDGEPLNS